MVAGSTLHDAFTAAEHAVADQRFDTDTASTTEPLTPHAYNPANNKDLVLQLRLRCLSLRCLLC
jgi:SHS2 domain-containing protein